MQRPTEAGGMAGQEAGVALEERQVAVGVDLVAMAMCLNISLLAPVLPPPFAP